MSRRDAGGGRYGLTMSVPGPIADGSDPDRRALLRRAIALAAEAAAVGDPPFGSLLVDTEGRIIREDRNTTLSERDVTAHPELKLARWAAANLTLEQAATVTMYTSCEPCAMCAVPIRRAGLARVVFALSGDQLDALRAGYIAPGSVEVPMTGPALLEEIAPIIRAYYREHA